MSASRPETFDKLFMASAKAKFPTDDSVRKVIYLAIQAASKKWNMPIQNWRLAVSRLLSNSVTA